MCPFWFAWDWMLRVKLSLSVNLALASVKPLRFRRHSALIHTSRNTHTVAHTSWCHVESCTLIADLSLSRTEFNLFRLHFYCTKHTTITHTVRIYNLMCKEIDCGKYCILLIILTQIERGGLRVSPVGNNQTFMSLPMKSTHIVLIL